MFSLLNVLKCWSNRVTRLYYLVTASSKQLDMAPDLVSERKSGEREGEEIYSGTGGTYFVSKEDSK